MFPLFMLSTRVRRDSPPALASSHPVTPQARGPTAQSGKPYSPFFMCERTTRGGVCVDRFFLAVTRALVPWILFVGVLSFASPLRPRLHVWRLSECEAHGGSAPTSPRWRSSWVLFSLPSAHASPCLRRHVLPCLGASPVHPPGGFAAGLVGGPPHVFGSYHM